MTSISDQAWAVVRDEMLRFIEEVDKSPHPGSVKLAALRGFMQRSIEPDSELTKSINLDEAEQMLDD